MRVDGGKGLVEIITAAQPVVRIAGKAEKKNPETEVLGMPDWIQTPFTN
jgi:hypothetical protein